MTDTAVLPVTAEHVVQLAAVTHHNHCSPQVFSNLVSRTNASATKSLARALGKLQGITYRLPCMLNAAARLSLGPVNLTVT